MQGTLAVLNWMREHWFFSTLWLGMGLGAIAFVLIAFGNIMFRRH